MVFRFFKNILPQAFFLSQVLKFPSIPEQGMCNNMYLFIYNIKSLILEFIIFLCAVWTFY